MKQTVGFCQFSDAFREYNRNENFSYEGKRALFDYLEQYEEDCGVEIELDVVALCCDFTESSLSDVLKNYSNLDIKSLDDLRDNTQVIMVGEESEVDPLIVYQVF